MEDRNDEGKGFTVSRRGFIKTVGGSLLATTACSPSELLSSASANQTDKVIETVKLELTVNGKREVLEVETRTTLAEALREHLNLTGTKLICDRGSCGGCTVMMGSMTVCACMTLALDAQGEQITTIEGLAKGDLLHPLQESFIENDALQCGFCTPGMIMSCKALLDRNPTPTLEDVKEAVSGNLCRCGTYPHVFEATLDAAKKMKGRRDA